MRYLAPEQIVVEFRYGSTPIRDMPMDDIINAAPVIRAVILGSPLSLERGLASLSDDEIIDLLRRASSVGQRLERLGFSVQF